MGITPRKGVTGYWFEKWIGFITEALACLNLKEGTWNHLPGAGGYYDQNEIIMGIWEYIKASYYRGKNDDMVIAWHKSISDVKNKKGKK